MVSPTTPSDLTLNDLEISSSKSLKFEVIIPIKREELEPVLLLNISRKRSIYKESSCTIRFDLETTLKGQVPGHSYFNTLCFRKE